MQNENCIVHYFSISRSLRLFFSKMERINKNKHLNMALRGAIIGQYKAGSSYGAIAQSLNVSVKYFWHLKSLFIFKSLQIRKPLLDDGWIDLLRKIIWNDDLSQDRCVS